MTRFAARKDGNQNAIKIALEAQGVYVEDMSWVGRGVPDLMCTMRCRDGDGFWADVFFMECKGLGGKLTKAEQDFKARWPGDVIVIYGPEDVEGFVKSRRG